jgi:hypothetical protein
MEFTKEEDLSFYRGIIHYLRNLEIKITLFRDVAEKFYFKDIESAQNILERMVIDDIRNYCHGMIQFHYEIVFREPNFPTAFYNFCKHADKLPFLEILGKDIYTYSIDEDEVYLEFESEFMKLMTTAQEELGKGRE